VHVVHACSSITPPPLPAATSLLLLSSLLPATAAPYMGCICSQHNTVTLAPATLAGKLAPCVTDCSKLAQATD
jgi:hypothetical protein